MESHRREKKNLKRNQEIKEECKKAKKEIKPSFFGFKMRSIICEAIFVLFSDQKLKHEIVFYRNLESLALHSITFFDNFKLFVLRLLLRAYEQKVR